MKKLMILGLLLLFAMTSGAQILVQTIAAGAKATDSVYGASTTYYYLNGLTGTQNSIETRYGLKASAPVTLYEVYAIQVASTRSAAPTGSDSSHFYVQVSLDNTNWHKLTGTVPKITGGAVYLYGDDLVTTTTNGAALFVPTANTWTFPYVRVVVQHYKATCTVYPTVKVLLKKL